MQPSLYLRDSELRRALALMLLAAQRLTDEAETRLAQADLKPEQVHLLQLVALRPGLAMGDLAARLRQNKQGLHRLTQPLIQRGWLEVRAGRHDRRRRCLYLTDAGRAAEQALFEAVKAPLMRAFKTHGPGAVGGYFDLLSSLLSDADAAWLDGAAGPSGAASP